MGAIPRTGHRPTGGIGEGDPHVPSFPGIGSASPRLEDEELITGRARFAADLAVDGALTMATCGRPSRTPGSRE